jgi:hypothetical protein
MLLTYLLNDFEIVPVTPIITGITSVFTFHMRLLLLLLFVGRDSSVGMATNYGWTVRGSNPSGGEIFRTRPN